MAFWQKDTAPESQPTRQRTVKPKVDVIKLSSELTERPADFSLSMLTSADSKSAALSQLIITLNKAVKDPAITGVLLELNSFSLHISQAQDIGALIGKLHAANKKVYIFADGLET